MRHGRQHVPKVAARALQRRMKEIASSSLVAGAVAHSDFLAALKKVQSSVSDRDMSKYDDWMEEYGAT